MPLETKNKKELIELSSFFILQNRDQLNPSITSQHLCGMSAKRYVTQPATNSSFREGYCR